MLLDESRLWEDRWRERQALDFRSSLLGLGNWLKQKVQFGLISFQKLWFLGISFRPDSLVLLILKAIERYCCEHQLTMRAITEN